MSRISCCFHLLFLYFCMLLCTNPKPLMEFFVFLSNNEARRKPNDVCQYSQPCPARFHGCGLPYPCHMQFATRQLRKPFATSKSVFRIHSMGAGTHQAWERKRQQWMSWMGWFIWGSQVHTTVASSNHNMRLTIIYYRWCMWNCRKSTAVICFSSLQWIIQAPKFQ